MHAQTHTLTTQVRKPLELRYLLWLPAHANTQTRWPLILFLHGSGERGDDLAQLTRFGLPRRIEEGLALPCLVVAPQCPADSDWELEMDALLALLDGLQARYPVDPQRVYLTGLSMGGRATWLLAARHTERFAAAVPICGRPPWSARLAERATLVRSLPIWTFHGARDPIVSVAETEQAVAILRAAGSDLGINRKRVQRYMREMGIAGISPGPNC